MTTWATFRSTVQSAITDAIQGIAPVQWDGAGRAMSNRTVVLSVLSYVPLQDRITVSASDPPARTISTLARVTVQVRFESIFDTSPEDSLHLAEACRLGLRRLSTGEILSAGNVGFGADPPSSQSANTSYMADDRLVSSHAFEVPFHFVFELDPGEIPGSIEQLIVRGETFRDVDGTAIEFLVSNQAIGNMTFNSELFSLFARKDGSGVINANPNASAAAEYWEIRPPSGEIWAITRMLINIRDAGLNDWSNYGALTALPNGIAIQTVRGTGGGATVRQEITDPGLPVTSNYEWEHYADNVEFQTGAGIDHLRAKWPFYRMGIDNAVLLDGTQDDALRIILNDDFTALDGHFFCFQGFKYDTTQVTLPG